MTTEETEATMPTERITLERARDLLARAVGTQGRDFIYNPGGNGLCQYTPMTDSLLAATDPRRITGCLIGVALDLAGVTVHHGYAATIYNLYRANRDLMDLSAANYFSVAQKAQDRGLTWGQAYDAAEASVAYVIKTPGVKI